MHAGTRNVDKDVRAGWKTWVDDIVGGGGWGGGLVDLTVDGFSCFHEAVAEMRVLVEGVGVSGEGEDVFMVAGGELGGCDGEGRFEDDLCGCTAQVEHPCSGFTFFATNVA
jgi:hypothetical protein